MTTVAQVRKVTRPLLERNPDLALVGRLVVITPVRHLVRGIYIDQGPDPIAFRPMWFVNYLFKRHADVGYTWGEQVYTKRGIRHSNENQEMIARLKIFSEQMRLPLRERRYPKNWPGWFAYDPTIAIEMYEVFEEQLLPMLRAVQSIADFITFTSDAERFAWTRLGSYNYHKLLVYAAQGDFEAALAACVKLAAEYPNDTMIKDFFQMLTDRDRVGLATRLHEWEADSVKRMKLDKFWEPTPFPIEMTS
jgi:hypothetical protein